jgi:oxygen-independent coproporphyrinogen-3 oxidase
VRYANVKPLARYCATLEEGALPIDTSEQLTPAQHAAERLFLGLRTSDGVPRAWLSDRAAADLPLARRLSDWQSDGRLVDDNGRVRLSEAGFLLSDALFVDLL